MWFAENAAGSLLHRAALRHFGAGRWQWRYVDLDELPALMAPFEDYRTMTFGLTAAFGRTAELAQRHGRGGQMEPPSLVQPRWTVRASAALSALTGTPSCAHADRKPTPYPRCITP